MTNLEIAELSDGGPLVGNLLTPTKPILHRVPPGGLQQMVPYGFSPYQTPKGDCPASGYYTAPCRLSSGHHVHISKYILHRLHSIRCRGVSIVSLTWERGGKCLTQMRNQTFFHFLSKTHYRRGESRGLSTQARDCAASRAGQQEVPGGYIPSGAGVGIRVPEGRSLLWCQEESTLCCCRLDQTTAVHGAVWSDVSRPSRQKLHPRS